jgi:hypothetical protein
MAKKDILKNLAMIILAGTLLNSSAEGLVNKTKIDYALANGTKISTQIEPKQEEENHPSEIYLNRYSSLERLFDKYSQKPPQKLTSTEYKALLIAIAQNESSLGYPNQKRDFSTLMGYGGEGDRGVDKQLRRASRTLKKAIEGKHEHYSSNGDYTKLEHILSIYNQGEINQIGLTYSKNVLNFKEKWENYLECAKKANPSG